MVTDALEQWLATRDALLDDEVCARARAAPLTWAERDGHRKYIDEVDARRDGAGGTFRQHAMRAALRATRERAEERPGLDVAALLALTSIALGARAEMRSEPAFCRDQRYGTERLGEIAAHLAGIDDTRVPVLVRACRAYLDVCFFHPFVDGNGRAARLAFDFVLSRTRCRFDLVTPLFCVLRPAGDVESHLSFVRVACTIAKASANRSQQERHA